MSIQHKWVLTIYISKSWPQKCLLHITLSGAAFTMWRTVIFLLESPLNQYTMVQYIHTRSSNTLYPGWNVSILSVYVSMILVYLQYTVYVKHISPNSTNLFNNWYYYDLKCSREYCSVIFCINILFSFLCKKELIVENTETSMKIYWICTCDVRTFGT